MSGFLYESIVPIGPRSKPQNIFVFAEIFTKIFPTSDNTRKSRKQFLGDPIFVPSNHKYKFVKLYMYINYEAKNKIKMLHLISPIRF